MSARPRAVRKKEAQVPDQAAPSPREHLNAGIAPGANNDMQSTDPNKLVKAQRANPPAGKAPVQEAQEQGAEDGPDKYPVPKKARCKQLRMEHVHYPAILAPSGLSAALHVLLLTSSP